LATSSAREECLTRAFAMTPGACESGSGIDNAFTWRAIANWTVAGGIHPLRVHTRQGFNQIMPSVRRNCRGRTPDSVAPGNDYFKPLGVPRSSCFRCRRTLMTRRCLSGLANTGATTRSFFRAGAQYSAASNRGGQVKKRIQNHGAQSCTRAESKSFSNVGLQSNTQTA